MKGSIDTNRIKLTEETVYDLEYIYSRLQKEFAAEELKNPTQFEKLMAGNRYKLFIAGDSITDQIIGYAFVYEIADPKALWLDYLMIEKEFQGSGCGSILFNKIAALSPGIIGVFSEVEIPDSQDKICADLQQRRIRFYERLGAKKLSIDYCLPTYDSGLPMFLYFRPSPSVRHITGHQIKKAVGSVFDYIHSDIKHKDRILENCISFVADEVFH
jgi:GNAT superfamily N-acetyltransferase